MFSRVTHVPALKSLPSPIAKLLSAANGTMLIKPAPQGILLLAPERLMKASVLCSLMLQVVPKPVAALT